MKDKIVFYKGYMVLVENVDKVMVLWVIKMRKIRKNNMRK
jgi:hypothetical protein